MRGSRVDGRAPFRGTRPGWRPIAIGARSCPRSTRTSRRGTSSTPIATAEETVKRARQARPVVSFALQDLGARRRGTAAYWRALASINDDCVEFDVIVDTSLAVWKSLHAIDATATGRCPRVSLAARRPRSGSLEFMVHRRLQEDDNRGVQGALNETMCGCNDIRAAPGAMGAHGHEGDGGCFCAGLTVRGRHLLVFDEVQRRARAAPADGGGPAASRARVRASRHAVQDAVADGPGRGVTAERETRDADVELRPSAQRPVAAAPRPRLRGRGDGRPGPTGHHRPDALLQTSRPRDHVRRGNDADGERGAGRAPDVEDEAGRQRTGPSRRGRPSLTPRSRCGRWRCGRSGAVSLNNDPSCVLPACSVAERGSVAEEDRFSRGISLY